MSRANKAKRFRNAEEQASKLAAIRLTEKIDSSMEMESAPCFCGSTEYKVVAKQDRYGIPVQTVICTQCALIRLEPRPSKAAYAEFYGSQEYRDLNRPRHSLVTNKEEEELALWNVQVRKAAQLQSLHWDHGYEKPKVVVDIGCHLGGMLQPFLQDGAEVYGVELNAEHRQKAANNGVIAVETIAELAAMGVKADLVIMYDMIEHFTDLNEVGQLRDIMGPESVVFIYTPGLFRVQFAGNSQIAHTYYFCANTLHFVLDCLGFNIEYADETCHAFAVLNPDGSPHTVRKPTEWVQFCIDEIEGREDRKLPPFSGTCKFTKRELFGNMERNLAHKFPDIYDITQKHAGETCVIVCGGPSINDQAEKVLALQKEGAKVISINRMYPWCQKHGIKPDYLVSLDCSEDQERSFDTITPGVTYLLSTVTRPSICDKLKDEKVYIFDSRSEPRCRKLRINAGYNRMTVINGGGSVSVLAYSIAFNLGFRNIHMFGFDSMVTDPDITHAAGIAGTSLSPHYVPITINEKDILTTPQWIEFTRQVLDLTSVAHDEGMLDSVVFHGGDQCLINHMWDGLWHEEVEDVQPQ